MIFLYQGHNMGSSWSLEGVEVYRDKCVCDIGRSPCGRRYWASTQKQSKLRLAGEEKNQLFSVSDLKGSQFRKPSVHIFLSSEKKDKQQAHGVCVCVCAEAGMRSHPRNWGKYGCLSGLLLVRPWSSEDGWAIWLLSTHVCWGRWEKQDLSHIERKAPKPVFKTWCSQV